MRGALAYDVTGEEIVLAIEAAARRSSRPVLLYARPLSSDPRKWLKQVRIAKAPKPATIDRVNALLAGREVAAAPPNKFQSVASPMLNRRVGSISPKEPTVAIGTRVDREPCWRCGTRGDVGCRHRDAGEPW